MNPKQAKKRTKPKKERNSVAGQGDTLKGGADTFATRRARLLGDIAELARGNGRRATEIRLIAISKTFPAPVLAEAVRAGQKDFGENRLQEAEEKFSTKTGSLTKLLSAEQRAGLVVHFVGTLQSKKVRQAVGLFDWIHTLDRPSLVEALVGEQQRGVPLPKLLIQVNTGEEPQKGGVAPKELDGFLQHCCARGLTISGLMGLPPEGAPPAPHFAWLAQAGKRHNLPELSFGMSGDWQEAVAFGATCIRLGTALFGVRGSPR